MRAYYSLPLAVLDGSPDIGGAIELSRDDTDVILLALTDPAPALEALGAERLGARVSDLPWPVAELVTNTTVQRTVDEETVTLTIPSTDLQEGDDVVDAGIPRIIIAGDDIEDYR